VPAAHLAEATGPAGGRIQISSYAGVYQKSGQNSKKGSIADADCGVPINIKVQIFIVFF
jgi:hypothetical protein